MAKKNLKRGLALGALMAFVITGSAYAHVINEVGDYSTEGKGLGSLAYGSLPHSVTVGGTLTIISPTDVGIQGYGDVTANKIIIDTLCTGIDGNKNDGDLNVSAKEIEITTEKYNGIQLNGGINKDINIKNFDKLNIIAGTKQEGHGISNNGSGEINISGKSESESVVNIVAAENAVYTRMNDNGKVSINAYDVTIESKGLGDDTNKGHAVIIRNKNADVSVTATNDVKISAISGKDAIRIDGSEGQVAGSSVNISAGNIVDINGQIYNRQGSLVDIDGKNITIDTNGEDAIVSSGGTVEIDAINDVKITSLIKDGIQTEGASVKLNAAKVEINAGAWGVNATADGGSNVVINAEDIKIAGAEGGVRTFSKGGSVSLTAKQNIEIAGAVQGADGIKSKIDLKGNDVKITAKATTPSETEGAVRNVSIEATGKVTINAEGLCGVGAGPDKATMAQAMNSIKAKEINITSDSAFGVYANNHSYYAVGTRVHSYLEAETINIESKKDGIYASNGAVIDIKNFDELNIKSNEQGINSEYGELSITGKNIDVDAAEQGIRSLLGGNIELNTESTAIKAGSEAIKATGRSSVEINSSTTQLTGDIVLKHDGEALGPNVKVNFGDSKSFLKGKVTTSDNGITELTFSNSASWDVTGDSNVSELNVNGGVIDLNKNVTVGTLAGSEMTVNATSFDNAIEANNNSVDNVTINASAAMTDALAKGEASTEDALNVVTRNGDGSVVFYGAASDVAGATTITSDANGNVTRTEATNTANAAVSDMASISMMTWRQENNDMNKRLGELRDSKGQYGAWARMARGESKYGAQGVKNQYNYYQIGYDEKLSTDPHWTVGVALTRTEGNSTFKDGSGENNHTGVAVYGSYLGENGSFIDLIAKYSRMDNEYKTTAGVGDADYKTNGYSVSAEYGKRFTKDNGLWIEPQVELTYGTVGSANYMTSKDASVRQDGIDSLVGRVGFALGKNIKAGNVYARASYLYDFDGEANVTYSKGGVTRSFEQDLGGGWWEVGIGSNINLSNATHLYFDVEKTYGGDVATPWQWNVGVRYSF